MKQDTRNLAGLLACAALLATLLGGCPASPVYAQPPGPGPTTCEECRTDAECERLCGGEYNHDPCLRAPKPCLPGFVAICIEGLGWTCAKAGPQW